MRALFAVVAAATILSGGMAGRAAAMTTAAPSALGVTSAAVAQKAKVICGNNGCAPVQTSHPPRRRGGLPSHI